MISVVVPVYNVEKYLSVCIDSILDQTYQKFELIIVDDGSTDKSGQICDQYKIGHPDKITVIHKKNGGLSDARNIGIHEAKGEYIVLIDSDDYICKTMFETLMKNIIDADADIAACKYVKVKKDEEFPSRSTEKKKVLSGDELIYGIYTATIPEIDFVAWNKLYKTELFKKYNISYPVGKYHEDEYITHKLLHICKRVVISNQPLYCYRFREGSIVNTPNSRKTFDYIDALEQTMLDYTNNEILAPCSLFRYMSVLYMNRKRYRIKSRERYLINAKMSKYIHLLMKQKSISFKRRYGLLAITCLGRTEMILLNRQYSSLYKK